MDQEESHITVDSFGKVSEVFVTDGGGIYPRINTVLPGPPESGGVLANLTNTGIGTTPMQGLVYNSTKGDMDMTSIES